MTQLELQDLVPTAAVVPSKVRANRAATSFAPREDAAIARKGGEGGTPDQRKTPGPGGGLSASPGLSLSRGAEVIYDHVNGHPVAPRAIAEEAGFFTVAVRRHLDALADVGLVVEEAGGWRRA